MMSKSNDNFKWKGRLQNQWKTWIYWDDKNLIDWSGSKCMNDDQLMIVGSENRNWCCVSYCWSWCNEMARCNEWRFVRQMITVGVACGKWCWWYDWCSEKARLWLWCSHDDGNQTQEDRDLEHDECSRLCSWVVGDEVMLPHFSLTFIRLETALVVATLSGDYVGYYPQPVCFFMLLHLFHLLVFFIQW